MNDKPTLKDLLDPSNLHYEFPLENKEARFKELVLYVADACVSDPTYSKIKLLKILFHSDFESFGVHRQPITGVPYRKLPYGHRWVQFFWNQSAKYVSEYSHGMAWKIAEAGGLIPYESVFISDDPVTFEEVNMVKALADKYGWKL